MYVEKISEHGYEEAVLGFSLSYNSTIDRTKAIIARYAWGVPGENKFLESIQVLLDVTAPRFWWQEMDTYRVGISKQSESTMHTIMKKPFSEDMFEDVLPTEMVQCLKEELEWLKNDKTLDSKVKLLIIKNMLPEGFLQRRIVNVNYKTLQNIINQRMNHRLPQWKYFCTEVLANVEHPEFLIKEEE